MYRGEDVLLCTGLMDAVHKAAFRGSLGRSLYMSPDRVGSYSTAAVRSYSGFSVAIVVYILSVGSR